MSEGDVEFQTTAQLTRKDWTDAQTVLSSGIFDCSLAFFTRGTQAAAAIIPSSELFFKLKGAARRNVPKLAKSVKQALKSYVEVATKGDKAKCLEGLNIFSALDVMASGYHITPLPLSKDCTDHPIVFQCSCPQFWHYFKCKHALAFALYKGKATVPPEYDTSALGVRPKPGGQKRARGGDALTLPAKAAKVAKK